MHIIKLCGINAFCLISEEAYLMADNKRWSSITPMDEDFAKWYTDIVKRQSLSNIQA